MERSTAHLPQPGWNCQVEQQRHLLLALSDKGLFQDCRSGQTIEGPAITARANSAQLVEAIQYLSLHHRSLLVAADTRMPSKDRAYACAPESRLYDGAVDRVESIVMDAGIRRRLTSDESTPSVDSGINVGGEYQVGSRVWLQPFSDCFTLPAWRHVLVLVAGAILSPGRRTVAAAFRVGGSIRRPVSPTIIEC
jgi:hypothetical protein